MNQEIEEAVQVDTWKYSYLYISRDSLFGRPMGIKVKNEFAGVSGKMLHDIGKESGLSSGDKTFQERNSSLIILIRERSFW